MGKSGHDRKTLIQRIFKLSRTRIGDIMIPMHQANLVNINGTINDLKILSARTKFSRFPVYERKSNNIIGTLNVYDILFDKEEKSCLRDYTKSPFFIKESELVDDVLSLLRNRKKPMAIVINDKGASVGIVTIEDLLEEIVGEIEG